MNTETNKGITRRSSDYSQWYQDIIKEADLAEHGSVKGTMIIKPYGYSIWEIIQAVLDEKIKSTGAKNVYFPLFIPEKLLNKEKDHLEGFSPEIAVVTYAGGKKLTEAVIVRPTSETIIYDAFSKWIESYRDLPMIINQWANVVRWEVRPRLFLRTTEFLWQEGHTAHASAKEADKKAQQMLKVYQEFIKNYLAIPTISGIKSDLEKFAGADITYTLEAIMQDGKALQVATSHNLGQNFAKVFDLKFINEDSVYQYCHQTSWGVSTRIIGGLIMTHGDDKGLVLPPMIAPIQVVIIPIYTADKKNQVIDSKITKLTNSLIKQKIRFTIDRSNLTVGEKYYRWEKKGVPVRIELGPKDIKQNSAILVRRDSGEKISIQLNNLPNLINENLDNIQNTLYQKALEFQQTKIQSVSNYDEFTKQIKNSNLVRAYWHNDKKNELLIKEKTGATIRCIPIDQKKELGYCFYTQKQTKNEVIFGKSY